MAKDDTSVGTMLAVSTYTNPSRRSILNMSFLTDIHNNTFRNQEVALRKKHLDEKIQIQADRLKQQNEKKLQYMTASTLFPCRAVQITASRSAKFEQIGLLGL